MSKRGCVTVFMFGLAAFLMAGAAVTDALAQNMPKVKEFRIERSMPKEAVACIECHKKENPGLFADWTYSRHAKIGRAHV